MKRSRTPNDARVKHILKMMSDQVAKSAKYTVEYVAPTLPNLPVEVLMNIFSYIPVNMMYDVCMICTTTNVVGQTYLVEKFDENTLGVAAVNRCYGYITKVLESKVSESHNFTHLAVRLVRENCEHLDIFGAVLDISEHWISVNGRPVSYVLDAGIRYSKLWVIRYFLARGHKFSSSECHDIVLQNMELGVQMFVASNLSQDEEKFFDYVDERSKKNLPSFQEHGLLILLRYYRLHNAFARVINLDRHKYVVVAVANNLDSVLRKLLTNFHEPVASSRIFNILINVGSNLNLSEAKKKSVDIMFEYGYMRFDDERVAFHAAKTVTRYVLEKMLDHHHRVNPSVNPFRGTNIDADYDNVDNIDPIMCMLKAYNNMPSDSELFTKLFTSERFKPHPAVIKNHLNYAITHTESKHGLLGIMCENTHYRTHPTYTTLLVELGGTFPDPSKR